MPENGRFHQTPQIGPFEVKLYQQSAWDLSVFWGPTSKLENLYVDTMTSLKI